jgi:chorismate synthase
MSGNTIGTIFRVTTYGESHGPAVGGVIDGCPAGLPLDFGKIRNELSRRRATLAAHSTSRIEQDDPQFFSGIFEGITTGSPIAFMVANKSQNSDEYGQIKKAYRPGHGDFSWHKKYGHYDHRGGGRFSARETVARVVAGAIAKQLLEREGIVISGWVSALGTVQLDGYGSYTADQIESSPLRCPDQEKSYLMQQQIERAIQRGDTLGGIISCSASGVPAGLGEPVFEKVEAELARALLGIPSVKGFEVGRGFAAAKMAGSEHNDLFALDNQGNIATETNHAGGTLGGLSSGSPINFRVAFKPVSSVKRSSKTLSHDKTATTVDLSKGRHDVCVVPRAVPIVEAMTAITLADMMLRNRSAQI